ncbi:MAG: YceI family protein [Myxococcota bacterium]
MRLKTKREKAFQVKRKASAHYWRTERGSRLLLLVGLFSALAFVGVGSPLAQAAEEASSPSAVTPPGKIEFVGKNLIANAEGTFHRWHVVEKQIDLAMPDKSYVVVEVDLSSIDTKNESRDDHLRTADFFDVETFPTARVRGYGLQATGETEAGVKQFSLSFDLDLHGVKKTVQGEARLLETSPTGTRFEGDLEINRVDFGIGSPASRWNPMSIKEMIPIHFEVELPSNG